MSQHFSVPEKNGTSKPRPKSRRETKGVLFVRNLPAAVKNKFASVCRLHEDKMQDVIEALMRLYNSKPECVLHYIRRRKK